MDLRRVKRHASGGSDRDTSQQPSAPYQPNQYPPNMNTGSYMPPQAPYAPSAQTYGPPPPQDFNSQPPPYYGQAPPGWNNPNFNTAPYPPPYNMQQQMPQIFNPAQLLNDPMASMAMQYGQVLAGQGKDIVNQKLERYMSISRLRHYFAVDTAYVAKKIGLVFFPFHHTDWTTKMDDNGPMEPRNDVNSPDLYIPSMAFVTYILFSGYILGLQNKFSPEQLGLQASSTLMWLITEVLVLMLVMYVMNIKCESLRFFDLLAYCGYKCVTMISVLGASLALGSVGYMSCLLYGSGALAFFLLRSLRVAMLSNPGADQYGTCSRSGTYLLLGFSLLQPLIMYWMTHSLAMTSPAPTPS